MNTANAAGYLIGALVAAPFGRRTSDKAAFSLGLFLTSAAIAGAGLTADFTSLLLLRAVSGLAGAVSFVAGAGLTSAAALRRVSIARAYDVGHLLCRGGYRH